jgi:Fe-S-cluster containining protein
MTLFAPADGLEYGMAKKKKPKQPVDIMVTVNAWLDENRATARQATVDGLQQRRSLPMVQEIMEWAHQFSEGCVEEGSKLLPPERPLACKEGCSWCCNFFVVTSAAEALRIAEYIRTTFPSAEVDALKERLTRLEEQIRGLDDVQRSHARLPCALLVDGRCSVYPVRPLPCAGYNSYDASLCERGVKGEKVEIPWHGIRVASYLKTADGIRAGLGQEGFSGATLELTAALRIALENPDAAERYFKREPVFEAAKCQM